MTLQEALQAIAEGKWTITPGDDGEFEAKIETERNDVPIIWEVSHMYGYRIRREHGWYAQEGDAEDLEFLVHLAVAMDAACIALSASLSAQQYGAKP